VFRFFDHTGDYGAELEAQSERELYEASIDALVALMVEDPTTVRETETRELRVTGVDAEAQLVALGNEVLFAFETGWLCRRVEVDALEEHAVEATAYGEPFDADRHPIARPVKAVTHHASEVRQRDDGTWRGTLVFDL